MAGYARDPNAAAGGRGQSEQMRRVRSRRNKKKAHAFSINGPLYELSGVYIAPWVAQDDCMLVDLGQEGPQAGTCDVSWWHNADAIDSTNLPRPMLAGDTLRPELAASTDAETVSATFAVR